MVSDLLKEKVATMWHQQKIPQGLFWFCTCMLWCMCDDATFHVTSWCSSLVPQGSSECSPYALPSMQCILPHPEVLHTSTQPAIITARRAPTSNACVPLDFGVATSDQHKVALAGVSCLECILPHPEVLYTSTQSAIITARRAPTSNMQQLISPSPCSSFALLVVL